MQHNDESSGVGSGDRVFSYGMENGQFGDTSRSYSCQKFKPQHPMQNLELFSYLSRRDEPGWTPFRDRFQQRETWLLCEYEDITRVE